MFGRKNQNQESSDDDDYSSSSYDNDNRKDNKNNGNFADENSNDDDDNPSEWQSINVYPPGQNDEEEGGTTNRSNNYDGSDEQTSKRRMMIMGLAVCCCCWLIASIVFGVLAFTKKDDKPQQTAVVTQPVTPTTPDTDAPSVSPITEPPSFNPSISPSGFLQSEFVYPALVSTYIQKGLTDPQSNSPTLLVENGNGDTDAYALLELDVSSKIDNIFRRDRRELKGQFTGKTTRSFLRLFLAADPGTPPPKLTLFKLPGQEDLKFLTAQEFNPVLAEELQSFRFSDLPHPATTGIANLDQNVFLPPPTAGDPIWIDITEVVDSATAFGDDTVILMLQNRDAVQTPGSGTRFYGVNSDDKPALVVFLDDTVPTISPVPSMSMAPSMNPSGSIYPTASSSDFPSDAPSIPPASSSDFPSDTPSVSARPSASERPSGVPSRSSAPSKSAQPSKVASIAPLASEFPTNPECLPCPQGQVLKWSADTVTSMSETCADLRLRLLYSEYAVLDSTPAQCTDILNTCGGCEAPVTCATCEAAGEMFQPSDTISVSGVSCQEAQVTLLNQEFAYGEAQCTALKLACTCAAPTNVCNICPENQAVSDPEYILSTSTMGLISCGDLEISGSLGYISSTDCSKLQSVGVDSLCECDQKSEQPSMLPSRLPSMNPSTLSSMTPSIQPSFVPSKQPSLSYKPSSSIAPSKQPSASNSPSVSSAPSKLPSTSTAPSATPK